MNRLLLMFALWGCGETAPTTPATPEPTVPTGPSVVLISLDTVRADRLGVYGGRAETPNLTRFGQQGVRFDAAMANFPETALSHWAMMTGVLPEVHGNVPAHGRSRYTGPTLAERLRKEGYATAAFIGGETLTDRSTGLARGFDDYNDAYPWDRADLKKPGGAVAADATDWMREQSGPYFAFVHFFDAHFPYTPPAPWDTRYDPDYAGTITGSDTDLDPYRNGGKTPSKADLDHVLALYDGELSQLDGLIAPVLDAAGPDAWVIVTADHGESFGHGYWFNHRDGLWDSVVRIPLLIRGPGITGGQTVADTVSLVDVVPTLLDLLGMSALERVHGRSLTPLLRGGSLEAAPAYMITDPARPDPQFAARTRTHKIIQQNEQTRSYDLQSDPEELAADAPIPETLQTAHADYIQVLQPVLTRWQGSMPDTQRTLSPDERERLDALGYTGSTRGGEADAPGEGAAPAPR